MAFICFKIHYCKPKTAKWWHDINGAFEQIVKFLCVYGFMQGSDLSWAMEMLHNKKS